MSHLHVIARCLGIPDADETPCAFCGISPFGAYPGGLGEVSEAVLALRVDPSCDVLCNGCRAILAGKPGSVPPPLRTQNLLCVDGVLSFPSWSDLRSVVVLPPAGKFVVSWAVSRKKHHVLYAGVSTAEMQRWGSDTGTIVVRPVEHLELLTVVEDLLVLHSRAAILSGSYSAVAVAKDVSGWQWRESLVVQYRGQRVFELLCRIAQKPESSEAPLEDTMIDPIDDLATGLLVDIARSSKTRSEDGLMFWAKGFFRRRVQRHVHRHLPELFSRLIDDCGCSCCSTEALERLTTEETHLVETALRNRAALLVALAFGRLKNEKH